MLEQTTIRRHLVGVFVALCLLALFGWGIAGTMAKMMNIVHDAVTAGQPVKGVDLNTLAQVAVVTFRAHTVYTIFLLLAIADAGWFVVRRILRASRALQAGADAFAAGNLQYRIAWPHRDEFGKLAEHFNSMATQLEQSQDEVRKQQQLAESLLLNVLPSDVADELKQKGAVTPQYHEDVTILFTDFKGFTAATENLAAEELVKLLHEYFSAFDRITERYGLEKLKTIGDSYMAVAGLPERKASHAVDAVLAAFEMVDEVVKRQQQGGPAWSVRVGVHTGPVVSGVVGVRKFAFDVWGESVNFASRMESSGAPNRINLSSSTYQRVKDFFACEARGKVATKEGREYEMFFATGAALAQPGFEARYQSYFKRELQALPESLKSAVAQTAGA